MKNFTKYLKEEAEKKDIDKIKDKRKRIDEKIFEYKIEKLNSILEERNINFKFNIRRVEDHYEFSVPIDVLFGPKTRKFAADRWKNIMSEADIDMDFSDEIEQAMNQIKGISIVMKLNLKMTEEIGQGEVVDNEEE